jgi:uncharacterized protein YbjQ (UPF0145 family)
MRRLLVGLLLLNAVLFPSHAEARDTVYNLKIDDAMHDPRYNQELGNEVAFFFGAQKTPAVEQNFGEFVTNRKTNSVGKPDQEACRWAMLSALRSLRERALKMGGNAVVNIQSYYRKNATTSETTYECHAGAIIAGVALRGTVVKLRR